MACGFEEKNEASWMLVSSALKIDGKYSMLTEPVQADWLLRILGVFSAAWLIAAAVAVMNCV